MTALRAEHESVRNFRGGLKVSLDVARLCAYHNRAA